MKKVTGNRFSAAGYALGLPARVEYGWLLMLHRMGTEVSLAMSMETLDDIACEGSGSGTPHMRHRANAGSSPCKPALSIMPTLPTAGSMTPSSRPGDQATRSFQSRGSTQRPMSVNRLIAPGASCPRNRSGNVESKQQISYLGIQLSNGFTRMVMSREEVEI